MVLDCWWLLQLCYIFKQSITYNGQRIINLKYLIFILSVILVVVCGIKGIARLNKAGKSISIIHPITQVVNSRAITQLQQQLIVKVF